MGRMELGDLPIKPSRPSAPPSPLIGETGPGENGTPEPDESLTREEIRAALNGGEDINLLRRDIDTDSLSEQYERDGYTRVENLFRPEVAESLYREIDEELSWKLWFNQQGEVNDIPVEELKNDPSVDLESMYDRIGRGARGDYFQALLCRYHLDSGDERLVEMIPDYVRTPNFQQLVESITGMRFLEATGNRVNYMQPGNFLRLHGDQITEGFTAVIHFTRDWKPDYGGLLSLVEPDGSIIKSFVPRFNSLVLFQLPTPHFVSQIAPYVDVPRYSVILPAGEHAG